MGTPTAPWYTASMFDFAGNRTTRLVRENVPTDRKLLDIGPGWGKYRFLLPEYEFDGVEVWEPYVRQNRLEQYYDEVHIMAAVDFHYVHRYGAVILGDVLEHMSVEDAQTVIQAACDNADLVVVAVPFEMPQGEEEGNHHEIHLQDDLTADLMAERYPLLTSHSYDGRKAIYVYGA